MKLQWPHAAVFAAGVGVGALGAAWLVGHEDDVAPAVRSAAESRPPAAIVATAVAAKPPVPQQAPCPGAASITAAGGGDGQLKLITSLSGQRESDVHGLIVIGKEAAAGGRPRDAEVAYIMACRVAKELGMDAVSLADAKYQLARHYANVAGSAQAELRDDLTRRARPLYEDALAVYTARLGAAHEKTRYASEGLVSTRPQVASAAPPREDRRNDTRVAGAPAAVTAPVVQRARPTPVRPSFDCAKAHSRSEKLICADPQLSQLDRELGQLHARAKSHARDARDFKRRSDAEWSRREAQCRDRECLLAWYAQRRAELLDEIDAGHG